MREETARSMVYFDGSAVRKLDYEPAVETRPERRPERRPNSNPQTQRKVNKKMAKDVDRALAFSFKYTVFVVASVMIMVASCIALLFMESRITDQENNINNLEAQLEMLEADNAAYANSLENMYSLEDINDVAINELGMVYAKKGQVIYYDSANEDYVKQYQDVPEAN
ncbi:MAG: hypothetical protein E7258_09985 [Lachnospiraceae bacterium]|nr:hypothetical protein [Lachnospiraceae bacterium]